MEYSSEKKWDGLIAAESKKLAATGEPDVQAALQRFRERRDRLPARIVPQRRWSAAAAVIIIAAAAAAAAILLSPPSPSTNWLALTTTALPRTDTLPDGSIIRLDPHTSLTYPANFAKAGRTVRLAGDALFTVSHDAGNPFRVEIKDLTVTVLGTVFRIWTTDTATEITVREGLVEVMRGQRRTKVLPHETLLVPQDAGAWRKTADTLLPPTPPRMPVHTTPARKAAVPGDAMAAHPANSPTAAHPAKKAVPPTSAGQLSHLNTMRAILDNLISDHLAPDWNSITWAALTDSQLILNGVAQPDSLHAKYKAKYLDGTGDGYFYGSVQVTGRGYFFNRDDFKQ